MVVENAMCQSAAALSRFSMSLVQVALFERMLPGYTITRLVITI